MRRTNPRGRYEQHGLRYFEGSYSEISIGDTGLTVETEAESVGCSLADLRWLFEPYAAEDVSVGVEDRAANEQLLEKVKADARKLWDMDVLDAWSEHHGKGWQAFHSSGWIVATGEWSDEEKEIIPRGMSKTLAGARAGAAKACWVELPESERKRIGERP